jgi:hypothetical protein
VRCSGRKGELRSTLTHVEGTGMLARAHRGLGLAGAGVQGGRRQWPGGGGGRGLRGRLAQRDSRVLGALDGLRGCQRRLLGEISAMQKLGAQLLARGAPWGRGESVAGLSGVGGATERRLDGDAEEPARRSKRAAALMVSRVL